VVVDDACKLVPMGVGISSFRSVSIMDEGIKAMIRFELNKGKRHASERQSILEMIETCDERIPDFMQPDLQDLQSYVSSLLNPGKNTSSAEGRTTSIFTSETTDVYITQKLRNSCKSD
jgi:hypothetical protein